MRVAIVLTVSKYTGSTQDLPVSEKAVDAVNTILAVDENFDQVLTIDSSSNSAAVKNQIREFVSSLKGEKISEFLFYFTGIGQLDDLGYYYLLSDYEEPKLLQTSLHNSELDLLVKSLSPELFVKIVDASYSGVSYVKEIETTRKVIERSAIGFDKCYFIFSSHENQPSSSSSGYSRFSLSFIESVKAAEEKTVRYKDVVDYMKDFYRTRGWQIPFFVIDADYTEVFCQKSDGLIDQLGESTGLLSREIELTEDEILLQKIQEEAQLYCAKEELPSVPESIIQSTEATVGNNEFLNLLFTPETETISEYSEHYHHNHVRDSMKKTLNNFCVIEEHGLSQHGRWGYNLHPTVETDIVGFRLKMINRYPNVDGFMIEFSIFLSVSKIRCVYSYYRIIDKGSKKSLEMKDTLYFFDVSPHDHEQIGDKLYQCIEEFEDYVKLVIKTKYSAQTSDNDIIQRVENASKVETEEIKPEE